MVERMANDLTRLTVNLTPKAVRAMEEAAARDEDSKTDVVNRSLQLYNLICRFASLDKSGVVTMLDKEGKEIRIAVL